MVRLHIEACGSLAFDRHLRGCAENQELKGQNTSLKKSNNKLWRELKRLYNKYEPDEWDWC